jgi:hypothetical protein
MIRPSDSREFAPELSSPADPSHAGPRGELDTGWGLRFLKFPYFRDGTLESIIFLLFSNSPTGDAGQVAPCGASSTKGRALHGGFFLKL